MAGGPTPYRRTNPATRAEKAALVFDLKAQDLSFHAIEALTSDPDGPTGGQRIPWTTARDLVREECARRVDPRADEYRAIELARLEAARERLNNMEASVQRVMARKHITVSNGRIIYVDDEPLEDDAPILQAVDRLLRIDEARRKNGESVRKLLGLDAPAKVSVDAEKLGNEIGDLLNRVTDATDRTPDDSPAG